MSYTDQSTNQGLRNTGKKSKPDIAEALSEKNLDREKSVQRGLESGIKAPKAKTSAARRPGKQAGKDPRDRAAREYGSKSQKNASCSAASRSENETRDKEYEERDLLGSGHNNFANAEVELMRRLELRDDGPAGYRSRNTLNPRKLLLGSQDLNLDDEKKPSFPVMSYSDHSNIQDSDSQISFYRCEHFDSSYSYNGYYNCSICSHWAGEMSYAHLLQNDILITQQHQFMSPKFTFRNVENIPPLVVGVFGRKKFEKLAIITQLSTSPHIIPSRKRSLQSACTVDMYVTPDSFVFLDVPVTRDSESGGEKFTSDSSTRSSAREQEEDNLISLLNSSRKVGTEVFGPGAGHEHRESVTSGRIYPQKLSEAGYPKFIWVQTNCDESSFRLRTYADKSCHFANSLDFPMNQVAGLEFNNSAFDRTYSNLVHNAYGPWTPINSDVNSASSECSLPSIDIQVAPVISDLAETMSLSHIYDNLKSSPPKPGSGNTDQGQFIPANKEEYNNSEGVRCVMKYPTSAIKPSEQVSTSKGLCILQNITNIVFKKYGWQPNLVLVPPIYGQRKRSDSNRKSLGIQEANYATMLKFRNSLLRSKKAAHTPLKGWLASAQRIWDIIKSNRTQ